MDITCGTTLPVYGQLTYFYLIEGPWIHPPFYLISCDNIHFVIQSSENPPRDIKVLDNGISSTTVPPHTFTHKQHDPSLK